MAMLLGRPLVAGRQTLLAALRKRLHSIAVEEGREACSFEDGEIDRLFEKYMCYLIEASISSPSKISSPMAIPVAP